MNPREKLSQIRAHVAVAYDGTIDASMARDLLSMLDDTETRLIRLQEAVEKADAALHDAGQQLCGTIRADVNGILRNLDASLALRAALAASKDLNSLV